MALLDKFDAIDPNELIDFLIERKRFLPKRLRTVYVITLGTSGDNGSGGEDFDLHQEIVDQLRAVKALRKSVVSSSGNLEAGIRDTKEALSATTSLLTLLTKIQGDVYNQDRIRTVQKVTIEVLNDVDPALRERFMKLLEERLGVVN